MHIVVESKAVKGPAIPLPSSKQLSSYAMFPLMRKGDIVWIHSKHHSILEDFGIILASAFTTGRDVFDGAVVNTSEELTVRSDNPLIIPKPVMAMYMHKYFLTEAHVHHMGHMISSYTKVSSDKKQFDGIVPFGMIQSCHFEYKINFWKSKECEVVHKALQEYGLIIIDDYDAIFGNKNMNIVEVFNVLNRWSKEGKTIIVLDKGVGNQTSGTVSKDASKIKRSDVVLEIDKSEEDGWKLITRKSSSPKLPNRTIHFNFAVKQTDVKDMPFKY